MNLEQLIGRSQRLKQELASAHQQQPWHGGLIDRLAHELADTERQIAAMACEAHAQTEPRQEPPENLRIAA